MAILRTKPTFALKPQVINTIKEGQLYLRAGYIDRRPVRADARRDDLRRERPDGAERSTPTAGRWRSPAIRRDLIMHLYNGMMMSAPIEPAGAAQPHLLQAG